MIIRPERGEIMAVRSLKVIAAEIRDTWKPIYYAAAPYVEAMEHLTTVNDRYGVEDGDDVVRRFLINAGTWRGEHARRIKAELKRKLNGTEPAVRTIKHLERLTSSANGNPRFRVHFTDNSRAVTASDAGFCYGLTNPEYRDVPVEVTFSRAGTITNITPA